MPPPRAAAVDPVCGMRAIPRACLWHTAGCWRQENLRRGGPCQVCEPRHPGDGHQTAPHIPRCTSRHVPVKRLKSLAKHIAAITEVFAADGAADGQLAGRMLLDNGVRGRGGQRLPSLRLVVRDKPHGARRLLQRTLPKEPIHQQLDVHTHLATRILDQTHPVRWPLPKQAHAASATPLRGRHNKRICRTPHNGSTKLRAPWGA